jgi:pyruvate dehydrogenase kinase 2/3/4
VHGNRCVARADRDRFSSRQELPIRLAHMLQEFDSIPSRLTQTAPARRVRGWYIESFEDLMRIPEEAMRARDAATVVSEFTPVLRGILQRHNPVVTTLAQGILELRAQEPSAESFYHNYDFHTFLDRFYTSRIGIRLLMQQHIQLFGEVEDLAPRGWVGAIDPHCRPAEVAEDAAENARFLCEQTFGTSPKYEIVLPNSKGHVITFSYIPSFLYHIVFELVKNSMRAVVETHRDVATLPPVRIVVVEGQEDCTLKISDEGGGIKVRENTFAFQMIV